MIVMQVLGLNLSWWALLALPAVLLIAFGFASFGMGITSYMKTFQQMDWINFIMLPMFLLSATFYPITVYPDWIQVIIQAMPLWHGVELVRGLTTGDVYVGMLLPRALLRRDDRHRARHHDAPAARSVPRLGLEVDRLGRRRPPYVERIAGDGREHRPAAASNARATPRSRCRPAGRRRSPPSRRSGSGRQTASGRVHPPHGCPQRLAMLRMRMMDGDVGEHQACADPAGRIRIPAEQFVPALLVAAVVAVARRARPAPSRSARR